MDSIEVGKRLMRQQVSADLGEKLATLRKANPQLSLQSAWAQLEAKERDLITYAARIEADQWETPKSPVYRYTPKAKDPAKFGRMREILGLPSKVEARKPKEDDGELMLVYGAQGEVIDIELT